MPSRKKDKPADRKSEATSSEKDKRLSLHPLSLEEALAAALAVKPDEEESSEEASSDTSDSNS